MAFADPARLRGILIDAGWTRSSIDPLDTVARYDLDRRRRRHRRAAITLMLDADAGRRFLADVPEADQPAQGWRRHAPTSRRSSSTATSSSPPRAGWSAPAADPSGAPLRARSAQRRHSRRGDPGFELGDARSARPPVGRRRRSSAAAVGRHHARPRRRPAAASAAPSGRAGGRAAAPAPARPASGRAASASAAEPNSCSRAGAGVQLRRGLRAAQQQDGTAALRPAAPGRGARRTPGGSG